MQIIMSRKGIDSSSQRGGRPNVLYQDKFYPIPVPKVGTGIRYDDLTFTDGLSYLALMKDLDISSFDECDLNPFFPHRFSPHISRKWPGLMGQAGVPNDFLKRHGVRPRDLFLFFGWFERVILKNGHFRYAKDSEYPTGMHVIYGFMQVGRIVEVGEELSEPWMANHPQYIHRHSYKPPNTLYISRKILDFAPLLPGMGLFHFHKDLILTKPGQPRSIWRLPACLYKSNKDAEFLKSARWTKDGNNHYLVNANVRAQEIVIARPGEKTLDWAKMLVRKFGRR